MKLKLSSDHILMIVMLICGLSALRIFLWTVHDNMGVGTDSTVYIGVARNIMVGNGFQINGELMTVYPPIYPLLLSLSGIFKMDPLNGAVWLHGLLYILNLSLIGIGVYHVTGRSIISSFSAMVLFIFSWDVLSLHALVLSGPLFVCFSLLGFLMALEYIENLRIVPLIMASVFFGLAVMTRYVGLILWIPMLLMIFFFSNQSMKKKIRDSIIFLVISLTPIFLWLMRNGSIKGSRTDQGATLHLAGVEHVKQLISSLLSYWIPVYGNTAIVKGILFGALVGFFSFVLFLFFKNINAYLKMKRDADANLMAQVFSFSFCIVYVLFLFIIISFFNAHTPLSTRMILPVYIFGLIGVFATVKPYLKGKYRRVIVMLGVGVIVILSINKLVIKAKERRVEGAGFTSVAWRNSDIMAVVTAIPADVEIYSNGDYVIRFLTQRSAKSIPKKSSLETLEKNAAFGNDFLQMQLDLMQDKAVIVIFDQMKWRDVLPTKQEIQTKCKVSEWMRFKDGVIYKIQH